jgi:NAD(P) transhydrogenase
MTSSSSAQGPAGEKGAAQAAYFGKRVALVERAAHLGGAGINTGTVPSKTLCETALYFSGLRQRGLSCKKPSRLLKLALVEHR